MVIDWITLTPQQDDMRKITLLDDGRITKERYIANKSIKKKTGGPTITDANN
jgi:hypothetical protein